MNSINKLNRIHPAIARQFSEVHIMIHKTQISILLDTFIA